MPLCLGFPKRCCRASVYMPHCPGQPVHAEEDGGGENEYFALATHGNGCGWKSSTPSAPTIALHWIFHLRSLMESIRIRVRPLRGVRRFY